MDKEWKDKEHSITLTNDEWAVIRTALYFEEKDQSRKKEEAEDLYNETGDSQLIEVIAHYQERIDKMKSIRAKLSIDGVAI